MPEASVELYQIEDRPVMGRNSFPSPFRVSDTLINQARIVHVVEGSSTLFAANQSIELSSGDTLIMKSDNFINNWKTHPEDKLNQIIGFNIYADLLIKVYDHKIPDFLAQSESQNVKPLLHLSSSSTLNSYYESLQNYFGHPDLIDEELICLKIREIISLLSKTDAGGNIPAIFNSLFKAGDYEFQEIIQSHLFEQLSLEELAFLSNRSLSSFKRKFQEVYGTSPTKYIISKRLEKAQRLLKTTDLLISQVGYECGFSDVSHFSKTFLKSYHISPSEYRNTILD